MIHLGKHPSDAVWEVTKVSTDHTAPLIEMSLVDLDLSLEGETKLF